MHLDVCLYVENYVLIGLDCVEPMMQFPLARHIFMHSFHAYIPFLFYLFVLGCDCVLFSLSLSDRLRMAPKRKFTSTWNPFRFGLSSSFDPPGPPLHI